MDLLMFPHGGCYNRGCEAIVRSTISMLDTKKHDVYLHSSAPDSDRQHGLDKFCDVIPNVADEIHIGELKKNYFAIKEKFFSSERDVEELCYRYGNLLRGKKNAVALSIGGDNYCYTGMQHVLNAYMKIFKHKDIRAVLWACSLEKSLLSPHIVDELKQYSLITVRETISQGYLFEQGIKDTVVQCVDPAFLLKEEETVWPYHELNEGETIGINISPLMAKYEKKEGDTYRSIVSLIKYILRNTKYNVALIPHVFQDNNSDLTPSHSIKNEVQSNRVFVIGSEFNCCQLKSLIAKCSLFIGCRTHATIAAYSSYVPTLVIGYSTKSRGIARDIYGTEVGHIISVQEVSDSHILLKNFDALLERKKDERKYLEKKMEIYTKLAWSSVEALERLTN